MRTLMVAAAMVLAMEAAQAQPPMPSHYSASGNTKDDLNLHKDKLSSMEIRKETCTGGVTGQAEIVGRAVVLRDGDCELRIMFNRNYTRARVEERNCTHLHGVSCQFGDGPVLRRIK